MSTDAPSSVSRGGVVPGASGHEGLVSPLALDVVADPQCLGPALVPGLAQGVADLGLLVEDDGGIAVADHEDELGRALAPVGGAEHRPELGRRQQTLEQPVAVLAQPQQPVAGADALRGQRVGESVHPPVEGRVGEPVLAAHRTHRVRTRADVRPQDVGKREVVEVVFMP